MRNPKPLKSGDVYPTSHFRDVYGKNASNRPEIRVDLSEVPPHLQEIVSLVERWAIPCDVTRNDYIDQQPAEDVAEFFHTAAPYIDSIRSWIRALPENVSDWPSAAVHFMYFLKAHAEACQPSADELAAGKASWNALVREHQQVEATIAAEEAFSKREYAAVVRLLESFADTLSPMHTKKLEFARKRISENSG